MIPFRLREAERGEGYEVEILDERYKVFGDFVNGDLFGEIGVAWELEWATEARAGGEPVYGLMHNTYETVIRGNTVTLRCKYADESGDCTLDEYIEFFERILAEVDAPAE